LVIGRGHRLTGIFTSRDAVTRVLAKGRDAATTKLADVMTPKPCTMSLTQSSVDALRLMQGGGFRHLPIVDDNGALLSVISRGDFCGLEQARLDEETGLWERI
jgi:CBS domain-containing protein